MPHPDRAAEVAALLRELDRLEQEASSDTSSALYGSRLRRIVRRVDIRTRLRELGADPGRECPGCEGCAPCLFHEIGDEREDCSCFDPGDCNGTGRIPADRPMGVKEGA